MRVDPSRLVDSIGIATPIIGVYDVPDAAAFEPLAAPAGKRQTCLFSFYENWLKGETLRLTADQFGCGGAGLHLFGLPHRTEEEFVKFLVDFEGLRSSCAKMEAWLARRKQWAPEHDNVLIGQLRSDQYEYLKTAVFFVEPDQLSALAIGAEYEYEPGRPPAVIAPFGSGCMQLVSVFEDLNAPQAAIGATDVAMRRFLPPNVLAFIVTKPMFEQLCGLDERSFLHKPFWKGLRRARAVQGQSKERT